MNLNRILIMLIIILCLFLLSCAGDPDQSFGFEIVNDSDNPFVEITSVEHSTWYDNEYHINYIAEDFSGIADIELYVNNELDNNTIIGTQLIRWTIEEGLDTAELKIKAIDNTGKESFSDPYAFEIVTKIFDVKKETISTLKTE